MNKIAKRKKNKLIVIAKGAVGASLSIGMGAGTLQKMGYSQAGMGALGSYVGPVTSVRMGKHMLDQIKPLIKQKRVVILIKKKKRKR